VHARAVSAGLCGDWDERRETFGAGRQVCGNEEAKADEREGRIWGNAAGDKARWAKAACSACSARVVEIVVI
jgi:hypothetical protein